MGDEGLTQKDYYSRRGILLREWTKYYSNMNLSSGKLSLVVSRRVNRGVMPK